MYDLLLQPVIKGLNEQLHSSTSFIEIYQTCLNRDIGPTIERAKGHFI